MADNVENIYRFLPGVCIVSSRALRYRDRDGFSAAWPPGRYAFSVSRAPRFAYSPARFSYSILPFSLPSLPPSSFVFYEQAWINARRSRCVLLRFSCATGGMGGPCVCVQRNALAYRLDRQVDRRIFANRRLPNRANRANENAPAVSAWNSAAKILDARAAARFPLSCICISSARISIGDNFIRLLRLHQSERFAHRLAECIVHTYSGDTRKDTIIFMIRARFIMPAFTAAHIITPDE